MKQLQIILEDLQKNTRYRSLVLPSGFDLTSNDYLGMAGHPVLREVAINALETGLDIGAAGSRLLRGHTQEHADLEEFAASHFASGGALYFSSGFQANMAILTTLPDRGDIVLYDALVHASTRDGLTACKAKSFKFAHNDLNALEDLLKRHTGKANTIWIAVESLYSMDGDVAPLENMHDLAAKYGAMLIVDEAHSTGVFGEKGKGLCWEIIEKYGYENLITLHTCGKAIGVAGGLVCADGDVIDYMINKARPFIYSTAPMPLQALLVQTSLDILASEEGQARRDQLMILCDQAKELFGGAGTQIVPILIGENAKTVQVATAMQSAGYDIRAIRPPTVPEGTARLRLSLSSTLEPQTLQDFSSALKTAQG